MSENVLDYTNWLAGDPMGPFFEKLNTLDPESVRETVRFKFVTFGFRGLYFDIVIMFRLIGQIMRRLNRDIVNLGKPTPKKWSPSDPEDDLFNALSLVKVDFTSLIIFLGILLEKGARLLHNITTGNRPSSIRFSKWRNDIKNGKYIVPTDLKELMINANWYDEFDKLRNKYTIHWGYSVGSIVKFISSISIQLLSHYKEDAEIIYDVNDINKLCNDILNFFTEFNDFLCNNFDLFPIRITKSNEVDGDD